MDSTASQRKLSSALDPRTRIYRDPFTELVVFVVSAVGAAVIAPCLLLIVGAFTGEFGIGLFVLACVAIELALIFGLARPQMKPLERVGWALLWGAAAAAFGAAFWDLVFIQLL